MDLKQNKPIHLNCPKCGYDFGVNTSRIEEDYLTVKMKLAGIEKELANAKRDGISKNSPKYKRFIAIKKDLQAQAVAIKKARSALSDESERQLFRVFKGLVEGVLGKEKTMELIKEAEDTLVYNDYDTAIQKYNRFNGS